MTACPDKEALLHGLLDGELDAANAQACEAWSKASPARGDSPVMWRCREASSRSCK